MQIRAMHVRARTALRAWWQAVCQPAGVHVRRRAAERERFGDTRKLGVSWGAGSIAKPAMGRRLNGHRRGR